MSQHQVFQEPGHSLYRHMLILSNAIALIEAVDQLSATKIKRTFQGNSLLSPLLMVNGFNSFHITLCTERRKYKDENFN